MPYNKTYKHNQANMNYPNLGLELRTFTIGHEVYYEWYSSTLNMASDIFKASRTTSRTMREEKDKFIAREIRYKNSKLPKRYQV